MGYGYVPDVLFYFMIDLKTNPFQNAFAWASFLCTIIFSFIGGSLIFLNIETVRKYQKAKKQNPQTLETFNEKNKH